MAVWLAREESAARAREAGRWRPVWTGQTWGTEIDAWNTVIFETVRTDAVRLEITARSGWAGGVHEWRVR